MVFDLCEITPPAFRTDFRLDKGTVCHDSIKRFHQADRTYQRFRNTFVAHQEQPLEDVEQARAALKEWSAGLCDIWKAHHQ